MKLPTAMTLSGAARYERLGEGTGGSEGRRGSYGAVYIAIDAVTNVTYMGCAVYTFLRLRHAAAAAAAHSRDIARGRQ